MNCFQDMPENRILTRTPFLSPKIYDRSVDITINSSCTYPESQFDTYRSSEVKGRGQIEKSMST
jgi:hypothetical protein